MSSRSPAPDREIAPARRGTGARAGGARPREGTRGRERAPERGLDARLLVPALIAWAVLALTIGWGAWLQTWLGAAGVATGAALLVAGLGRRKAAAPNLARAGPAMALVALAVGVCVLAGAAHTSVRSAGPILDLARKHAVVSVVATVTSDPRLVASSTSSPPASPMSSSASSRPGAGSRPPLVLLTLQVRLVSAQGRTTRVASPVLVFASQRWLHLAWRSTIRASGRLQPVNAGEDVIATFSARGDPQVLAPPGAIERAADDVRQSLRRAVSVLPTDARGLLPALVLGDTSASAPDLTSAMRATGLTHLSAVSGSNVSFVLAFAMFCCRGLGVPRRARPVVAGLVLAGFVVLARPEPSVLRAAVMGAIGLLGLSTSRRAVGVPALSGAVLVLLCIDPWLARSYGFVLSTLATLGLLLFAHGWGRRISRHLPQRLEPVGLALAIPLAAQLMCAPVIVLLQGTVSLIGIPANLLAAPFVAPATILGVATAVTSVLSAPLASVLAWCAALPTLAIAEIARIGAGVPGGQLPWPDGAPGAFTLAGLSLALLLVGPWLVRWVRRHPVAVVAAAAVLLVGGGWPLPGAAWPPSGWRLVMCDVGQGDGMALSSGAGHAVVVDTGTDPAVMDRCLQRLHVSVVDAVVLTHFHFDHAGGLAGVLAHRSVKAVYVTPLADPPAMADAVRRETSAAGVPERQLVAGDVVQWGSVRAQVLWPAYVIHSGSMPNNASISMLVDDDGLRLLMLGDVEHEAAAQVRLALQRDSAFAGVDVLKVAHHGSANQDPGLIAMTHARIAVISVGQGNDYGQPSPKLLSLLAADRMAVYRTDLNGAIAIAGAPATGVSVSVEGR